MYGKSSRRRTTLGRLGHPCVWLVPRLLPPTRLPTDQNAWFYSFSAIGSRLGQSVDLGRPHHVHGRMSHIPMGGYWRAYVRWQRAVLVQLRW